MYASVQRYIQVTAPPEDVMPAGRDIAVALQRLPGFIAYVLLDGGAGSLVAVSLFEDEAGLEAAAQLPALGVPSSAQHAALAAAPAQLISGEVLVQKGL